VSFYLLNSTLGKFTLHNLTGYVLVNTAPSSLEYTTTVVSASVIEVRVTGFSTSITVTGVGTPIITYNGKSIILPKTPFEYHVDPAQPRVVTTTLTGVVDTLKKPRMDVHITAKFRPATDRSLLHDLENLWQYIQAGGDFAVSFDSAKVKSTLTTSLAPVGGTAMVVADPSNIHNDEWYVLRGGPNYQVVRVLTVVGNIVNIYGSLDKSFPIGSIFRDIYCWQGKIRDEGAGSPITEILDMNDPRLAARGELPNAWALNLDFFEKV
jgi:hypothetical protein